MFETSDKINVRTFLCILFCARLTACDAVEASNRYPCRFGVRNENVRWLREDGSLRFPAYATGVVDEHVESTTRREIVGQAGNVADGERSADAKTEPCFFSEETSELICKETIDFKYLKNMRDKRIKTFTVDSYVNKEFRRDAKNASDDSVGEWARDRGQKITGEIRLEDIHLELRTVLDLERSSSDGFAISGEVFSNRIIKIGWKYRGEAEVSSGDADDGRNATIRVRMRASENENGWELIGDVDRSGRTGTIRGNITRTGNTPSRINFDGFFEYSPAGVEKNFSGQIFLRDSNMAGAFFGRFAKRQCMEITIPRGAFARMSIRNLAFKNSNFYGDFDTYSFEGINDLETIVFSNSTMEFMPSYDKIFRGAALKAIYIERSSMATVTTGNNCCAKNLELISFKDSGFLEFSNESFLWLSCSNITYLNLHDANFKLISNESVLEPIGRTLKFLDISYSTMRQESSIRQVLSGLRITHLSLAGLQLKSVPTAALEAVKSTLAYLTLRKNNFEKVPGENILVAILNFPHMPYLRELDLSRCQINYVEKGTFDPLANLERLDLSHNNVVNLQDGWATVNPGIVYLDLSYNRVVTRSSTFKLFDVKDMQDLRKFGRLETMDLSFGGPGNVEGYLGNLNGNLRHLSLCGCGLTNLNESTFRNLCNLEELDLSGNPNLGKTLSLQPLRYAKSLRVLHIVRSNLINWTCDFSDSNYLMQNLEYLDLSNNYLKAMCPDFLKLTPNLKTVKLSQNGISRLPEDLLSLGPSLQSVYLDNNNVDEVPSELVAGFVRLDGFALGNNPFVCDCFVLEFLRRLVRTSTGTFLCSEITPRLRNFGTFRARSKHGTDVALVREIRRNGIVRKVYLYEGACASIEDWSANEYQCYSRLQRRFLQFVNVNETFDDCSNRIVTDNFDWLYVTSGVTVLFCVFLGFLWWKWWNFRLFVKLVKNAAIFNFIDGGDFSDAEFLYDAFVSYSDVDRSWVTEKLIPNLEKLNDIKICLHERDFQVGLSILENIVTSIDKSRCIILVLSQAFIKSQWCQYEMHLAYHRLLEARRDQMILILMENIPRYMRPKTLRYLMMTKTYLQWPSNASNSKEEELFWNRLFKSLLYMN